jgi:hypothetical protein
MAGDMNPFDKVKTRRASPSVIQTDLKELKVSFLVGMFKENQLAIRGDHIRIMAQMAKQETDEQMIQ